MHMVNFTFNLAQVYEKGFGKKAEKLKKEGKKIPQSFYNPKETAIYISCAYDGYVKTHTGLKIRSIDFNVSTQRIKTRDQKSAELQHLLDKIKNDCMMSYLELKRSGKRVTKLVLKEIMEQAIGGKDEEREIDFFEIFDSFFEWKSKHVTERTLRRYRVFKKYLLEFEKQIGQKLMIDEIDQRFAECFTEFLIEEKNLMQNSYIKYLKLLRGFARYCLDNGLTENTRFKKIRAKGHHTSVFVPTSDEIERIEKLKINDSALKEVRDAYLFLTYTGQRYSDIVDLKWKDIVYDGDYVFWKLFQKKTRSTQALMIPLLPCAIALIEERKSRSTDVIFNVISNQKMNDKLKTIAKRAKIQGEFTVVRKQGIKTVEIIKERSSLISCHSARRYFITNALSKNMSVDAVRRISGHRNYSAMLPYINMTDKNVADQLMATHTKEAK